MADQVGGAHAYIRKFIDNGDGTYSEQVAISGGGGGGVSSTVLIDTADTMIGVRAETAPATDIATSGLNGRMQRVAQRLTTLITALGTQVFGAGTAAAAQRVTLASNDPAVTALAAILAGPLPVVGIFNPVSGTMTKSTKTTAYTSGLIIAQSATAGSCSGTALAVGRVNDATGLLRRIRLKIDDATWLNAIVRAHFFKDTPTFTNGDAGNFAAGVTESTYLGAVDVTLDKSFSDYVKGIGVPNTGNEINFETSTGTQNIFYVLEARSTTAGAHTASKVFRLVAETFQN